MTQSGLLSALIPVNPPPSLWESILKRIGVSRAAPKDGRGRFRRYDLIGGGAALGLLAAWGLIAALSGNGGGSAEAPTSDVEGLEGTGNNPAATWTPPVTIESNFWTATPVSPTASPTPTASLPPTLTATQTLPPSATFTPSATADTSGPTATNANDSPDPIYTNGNAPDTATITVQVVDPAGVASVQLYYNKDGGKYVLWGAMALSSGNTYWTAFGPFPAIGTYNYRILATDALGNANCPPGGIAGCPGGSVTVIIP